MTNPMGEQTDRQRTPGLPDWSSAATMAEAMQMLFRDHVLALDALRPHIPKEPSGGYILERYTNEQMATLQEAIVHHNGMVYHWHCADMQPCPEEDACDHDHPADGRVRSTLMVVRIDKFTDITYQQLHTPTDTGAAGEVTHLEGLLTHPTPEGQVYIIDPDSARRATRTLMRATRLAKTLDDDGAAQIALARRFMDNLIEEWSRR